MNQKPIIENKKLETKKAYIELKQVKKDKFEKVKKEEVKPLIVKATFKTKNKKIAKKKVKKKYVRNEFRDPDFFTRSINNETFETRVVEAVKVKIASAKAALRAGPGINYPRIKVMLRDSKLRLLRQFESWTKVKDISGVESWVSNQDIAYE